MRVKLNQVGAVFLNMLVQTTELETCGRHCCVRIQMGLSDDDLEETHAGLTLGASNHWNALFPPDQNSIEALGGDAVHEHVTKDL